MSPREKQKYTQGRRGPQKSSSNPLRAARPTPVAERGAARPRAQAERMGGCGPGPVGDPKYHNSAQILEKSKNCIYTRNIARFLMDHNAYLTSRMGKVIS